MSTVSHEFARLGAEATKLALDMIEGRITRDQAVASRRGVPARFIARPSTGPAS
jgi:DNA-binding LacI/PurR family transcriptional regulator